MTRRRPLPAHPRWSRRSVAAGRRAASCLVAAAGLVACSGVGSQGPTHPPATGASSVPRLTTSTLSPGASTSTTPDAAGAALARMSLPQRVGQVFMVGSPATAAGPGTLRTIRSQHVGNVMLTGRSAAGVAATRRVADRLRTQVGRSSTSGVPLLVATDQEGGAVQVLRGPGFSRIPAALVQGSWPPATLRTRARGWAAELRSAGVDLNLAPVVDTVPSAAAARRNQPIGVFERQFGYDVRSVTSHATAFARGMADAGVATSPKHFPGLGRVRGNTDTTSGVTDSTTERRDPYLAPFAASIYTGARFVMMSTAVYARIDPSRPAAFSRVVVTGMLRGDLGFDGVVISDDLGSARQVLAWTPGARATSFLDAGGDLVLTVDPAVLPAMYDAVLARARTDRTFRRQVEAAALRVLRAKQVTGAGLGAPVAHGSAS